MSAKIRVAHCPYIITHTFLNFCSSRTPGTERKFVFVLLKQQLRLEVNLLYLYIRAKTEGKNNLAQREVQCSTKHTQASQAITSFRMKRNQDCSHFQLVKPSFNLFPKQFSFSPSGFD